MLSKELGTHLTGRHISLSLYPFSFSEYLDFRNIKIKPQTARDKSIIKNAFNDYLASGGFPEFLQTGKEEYLKSVFENILYRDIIARYKLPSERSIKEVAIYVAGNIGKELSFNTLKKLTGLTSTTTIREYFEYLENSYLVFLINRYSPSLKKQIYYNKKAYIIDTGIASVLGFRTSKDAGRILENTVYLALRRKHDDIYFHKEKKECDFLIREKGRIINAIQVTKNLSNKNNKRELSGLKEAMKMHKLKQGIILTDNQEDILTEGDIKIVVKPVWKWLLEEDT